MIRNFKYFIYLNQTVILILFFSCSQIFSQPQTARYDSLITDGVKQIYNIKFEQAEETFAKVKEEFPNHPAGYFFDAMIYWWEIMLDFNNENYDDTLIEKLEFVIDLCDEILDENPEDIDAIFFKGGALGYRGRLAAVRESWLSAGLDGKEALPLVYRAYELDSLNTDVQLGFGIYNYYAAVIPEQFPIVKPIMALFPAGNKKSGIAQLEEAAFNGRYSKYEARYFLMTLFYRYEKDYASAFRFAKMLHTDFPDNPSFQRYYGRILVGLGNYKNGAEVFADVRNKCLQNQKGYSLWTKREAAYYIAMNFKNSGNIDSAFTYFKECAEISAGIDEDKESGFLINATLYLAILMEQKGNIENAVQLYEHVLDMREFQNSHEKAETHLNKIRKEN